MVDPESAAPRPRTTAAGSDAFPGGGLKLGAARVPRNLIPRALS